MMIKWENGAKVTFGRSLLQLYIQKYVSARELSLLVDVQPIGKACGRKLKCLVELPVDIGFAGICRAMHSVYTARQPFAHTSGARSISCMPVPSPVQNFLAKNSECLI